MLTPGWMILAVPTIVNHDSQGWVIQVPTLDWSSINPLIHLLIDNQGRTSSRLLKNPIRNSHEYLGPG